MSDPKNPGVASPAIEPDSATIRVAQDFYGEQATSAGRDLSEGALRPSQPARPQHAVPQHAAATGGSGRESIGDRFRAKAKTVSAGVDGATAGALGNQAARRASAGSSPAMTGTAASAVPPPDGEDTDSRPGVRRTRKARLRLAQVDPWSVMKTAFLFSVAAGIVLWVATGTLWAVISSSGMFEEINRMVGDVIQTPGDDTPFRIQDYLSTSKVMGTAALVAVLDVVIFTALATLGAFLYNLASAMIGGLEVTLAED